jgi:hypothetical protein
VPATHPPALLIASAASPLVAQVLTKALAATAQPRGGLVVRDVVPLPADDPRGVAALYLVLGLLIGGYCRIKLRLPSRRCGRAVRRRRGCCAR